MRINNNIMAMNTHRQLGLASTSGAKSMSKLSSGYRINNAADDAAGLSISEKMRGQIRGLNQASRNAQDGISLIQTAEGALNETHAILQRMRELAVQSATDTNTSVDRDSMQSEMDQLAREVTRIADTTEFNKQTLMGSGSNFSGKFLIGANGTQTIQLDIGKMDADTLNIGTAATTNSAVSEVAMVTGDGGEINAGSVNVGSYTQATNLDIKIDVLSIGNGSGTRGTANVTINGVTKTLASTSDAAAGAYSLNSTDFGDIFETGNSITITPTGALDGDEEFNIKVTGATTDITGVDISSTRQAAEDAISVVDNAIETVSTERSKLGSVQNRLEHTIKNLDTSAENLQASESRIRDVDMAKEMMEFTKNNILNQAANAMLAQANQAPQAVLQLLR